MDESKRIFEINGVKLEVDLRTAQVSKVDTYKVGDSVKLLFKQYSSFEVKYGVIAGFEQFKQRPTIVVAYLDYSELKFANIFDGCEHEIVPVGEHDLLSEREWIEFRVQDAITKKEIELSELKNKKSYFTKMFGKYFEGENEIRNML